MNKSFQRINESINIKDKTGLRQNKLNSSLALNRPRRTNAGINNKN